MKVYLRKCLVLGAALIILAGTAVPALAHGGHSDPLAVKFEQNLNAPLPLPLAFRDETGQAVRLGDYFGEKPAVLVMGYFECPSLCINVVFPELVKTIEALDGLAAGEDFSVIAVSIDSAETPAVAAEVKGRLMSEAQGQGWHFLTGSAPAIAQVADAIGFHYAYDEALNQYAHPTGIVVLTPEGRVARYIFGIEFPPRDLRLALVEAGQGRIGTAVDQLLLLCYHYDPVHGRYSSIVWAVVRLLGLGSVMVLAAVVWRSSRGIA